MFLNNPNISNQYQEISSENECLLKIYHSILFYVPILPKTAIPKTTFVCVIYSFDVSLAVHLSNRRNSINVTTFHPVDLFPP